ncbi:MAG: hypothetical protein U5L72_17810 [Bacteroidales bacterium]|nr:hypothetical protein [Bacteroidales bacterium]
MIFSVSVIHQPGERIGIADIRIEPPDGIPDRKVSGMFSRLAERVWMVLEITDSLPVHP